MGFSESFFILFWGNVFGVKRLGFLSKALGREKKHSLGVCIPDSRKEKVEETVEEQKQFEGKAFEVTGIFHVQESLMVQGKALGGAIRKKDSVSIGGAKFIVKDIQTSKGSVDSISEGEKGALFLKAKTGKFGIIRTGDILEF